MYLSGFHGTTLERARSIMRDGRFNRSEGEDNWLGSGVYFYTDIEDACAWRDAEVVLHSIVQIDEDQLFDFDSEPERQIFEHIARRISEEHRRLGTPEDWESRQRNQDFIARMLHLANPHIEAFVASFPVGGAKPPTIFDPRPLRREFCLIDYPAQEGRRNSHIRTIRALSVEQINGSDPNPCESPI